MGYLGREVAILQIGTGPTNGRKSPPQRQNMGRCHHHGCFQQHRSWSWRRVPMSGRVCLSDAFLCFFPNSSDIHRLSGSILWWRPKRVAGQPFGVGEMDLPRIRFPSNKATAVLSVLGIQYSSSRTVTVGQQLHLTNSDWPGKSSFLKTWRLF